MVVVSAKMEIFPIVMASVDLNITAPCSVTTASRDNVVFATVVLV